MSEAEPIRRWLVEAAQRMDAALGPARVARVVLPPLMDKPGKEGEFCAVQLDDGAVGLAFAILGDTLAVLHSRRSENGRAAMELVRGCAMGDLAARTLGLAAINALTRRLYDRARFVPEDSADSFSLALRPELVREAPGLVVTLDASRLAGCNKVVSTSSVLLNDTFDAVSSAWRGAEAVAIVGPSAGCPPDPLFAAGVSAVGTAWVTDAEPFLARLAAGEKWGTASRKVTLTPQRYPGLEALLEKAG